MFGCVGIKNDTYKMPCKDCERTFKYLKIKEER